MGSKENRRPFKQHEMDFFSIKEFRIEARLKNGCRYEFNKYFSLRIK